MRGRARPIASVLADALAARREARMAAVAAAFNEACGWPLAREVSLRGVARDGRLVAVASSQGWADEVARLAQPLCDRVNARLGRRVASGIDVRVGPVAR